MPALKLISKFQRYGERYGKAENQGRELQLSSLEGNGRPDWTRTNDLIRVKDAL